MSLTVKEKPASLALELGAYTDIADVDFPTKVQTGKDVSFSFTNHVRVGLPTDWTNLALGIQYVDGPQDKVTADSLELNKGGIAAGTGTKPSTCTNTKLSGTIKALASAGRYTFRLLSGHTEAGTFYADSALTIYMDVEAPPAPTTPSALLDVSGMMNMMMSIMMLVIIISLFSSLIKGFKAPAG